MGEIRRPDLNGTWDEGVTGWSIRSVVVSGLINVTDLVN